jgi:hypothetical protein
MQSRRRSRRRSPTLTTRRGSDDEDSGTAARLVSVPICEASEVVDALRRHDDIGVVLLPLCWPVAISLP